MFRLCSAFSLRANFVFCFLFVCFHAWGVFCASAALEKFAFRSSHQYLCLRRPHRLKAVLGGDKNTAGSEPSSTTRIDCTFARFSCLRRTSFGSLHNPTRPPSFCSPSSPLTRASLVWETNDLRPGGRAPQPQLATATSLRRTRVLLLAAAREHPSPRTRQRLLRAVFQPASVFSFFVGRFFCFCFVRLFFVRVCVFCFL